MPFTLGDAFRHTHKAKSPIAKRQWAHVAEGARKKGASEASAIRMANAVVSRRRAKTKR
jgi:hypothetical protein